MAATTAGDTHAGVGAGIRRRAADSDDPRIDRTTRLPSSMRAQPWTLHSQTRFRHFGGDTLRHIPGYADVVARDDGLADLSWTVFDERSNLLHVLPDRLYID